MVSLFLPSCFDTEALVDSEISAADNGSGSVSTDINESDITSSEAYDISVISDEP